MLNDKTRCSRLPLRHPPTLHHGTVISSEGSEASTEAGAPMSKSRGLGGYADAKVHLRGLCLKSRARGCKPCPNTMELCPKSLQVTSGPYP